MARALWRQYASFLPPADAALLTCEPAFEFPFTAEPRSEPTTEIPPPMPDKSSLVNTCFGLGLFLSALAFRAASESDDCLSPGPSWGAFADCAAFLDCVCEDVGGCAGA